TFTSMLDMGKLDYPYLPVNLLLNQRFDSIDKIGKLKIPVLLIHGTWDPKVPWQMSRRLYDAAPEPKTLKLIAGGEHSNSGGIASVEYKAAFSAFVQRYAH
ncbi:MAG: alpha/beta hydrolase, partial [Bryobacteraceae bacterium]